MSVQLFGKLDAGTDAALRESIRRWGVIVPVVYDQRGRLIDGHQRKRIARQLRVPCPSREVQTADEAEARELALSLNADRRQISVQERRRIVAGLRASGHSQRAIAGAVGVSKRTVAKDLATGSHVGTGTHLPATTTGRDGKTYPAQREATPPRRPFADDTEAICLTCGGTGRVQIGG